MFFWSRSRFTRVRTTGAGAPKDSAPGLLITDRERLPCFVRPTAKAGAIIEIDAKLAPDLPEHFFLKLDSDRTHRRVRLAWQHQKQAGVEYVTTWSVQR